MNIFKTLASGSGSINEPNVSAFLGYLLNPKEDHGLGDTFLRKFLEPLKLDSLKGRNLSIRSNFEMVVLLEQAFKKDKGKKVVDIVILCYENESQQGQFLAENIIRQKQEGGKSPSHIFLIENKIDDEAVRKGEEQLQNQYQQTIKKLDEIINKDCSDEEKIKKLVSVIFVTPGGANSVTEFKNLTATSENIHLHLFWNKGDSISKMIKEILEKGTQPIDVYCKHTLQAFLEFIENDFKSTITEELAEKKKESPRFEYNGEKYSRPLLAKKLISDYVEKYEKEKKKKIAFDELKKELFPTRTNWSPKTSPFNTEEEAIKADYRKDGTKIYDNFGYYPDLIEIEGAVIRIANGWSDEKELQELLDKTTKGVKLDNIRIK